MKNKIIKIVAIGLCIFASQSYALDGSGKIEEFKICGAGGSWAFADPEVNLAVGVTLNKMEVELFGPSRALEISDLIREELGVA